MIDWRDLAIRTLLVIADHSLAEALKVLVVGIRSPLAYCGSGPPAGSG